MGNPDSATPPHIVAKLVEAVQDPRTHRYSTSKGIPGLRRALAGYYQRRFGVQLDPETEVIATLGSKEGLANLAAAITSPGRHHPGAQPVLPNSSIRFHYCRRRRAQHPGDPGRRHAAGAGPRGAPFGAEADGADRQFPVQPDGLARRSRFLPRDRGVRAPPRDLGDVRSRLCRDLFRRQAAAVDPAGRRARKDIAVEFTSRCRRPIRCPAGAWASPPATAG